MGATSVPARPPKQVAPRPISGGSKSGTRWNAPLPISGGKH